MKHHGNMGDSLAGTMLFVLVALAALAVLPLFALAGLIRGRERA